MLTWSRTAFCLAAAILMLIALAPPAGADPAGPPASVTLVDRGILGAPATNFWAISGQTATNQSWQKVPSVGKLVNATPVRYVRIGGGADACNLTTDTNWVAGPSGGRESGGCSFNINDTKAWCDSLNPNCVSLVQLPGENNNSGEDANIIHYILVNESFRPTFVAIGNEPDSYGVWTHYGIPWSQWKTTDNSTAKPRAYALDVQGAITAIRSVYFSLRITQPAYVGIEAATGTAAAWFRNISHYDSSLIGAIAYHSYPTNVTGGTQPTLAKYEGALVNGASNLTHTFPLVRAEYLSGCPNGTGTCATPSIQVGEYNGGPGGGAPTYDSQFPGVTYIASSVCQALETSIPALTYYVLQSRTASFGYAMMNSTTATTPVANLYKQILPWLTGEANGGLVEVHNTSAKAENFWSVLVETAKASHGTTVTNYSVLMVNANITASVTVATSSVFPTGAAGKIANWSGGGSPTFQTAASFAASYTLPADSLLLLSGLTIHIGGGNASNGTRSDSNGSGNPTNSAEGGSNTPASTVPTSAGDSAAVPRPVSPVQRRAGGE